MLVQEYLAFVADKIAKAAAQAGEIEKAADLIVESHVSGKHFFLFGTGHSHLVAEELYLRAGGLAFVRAILPAEMMLHEMPHKSTLLERLPRYAEAILTLYGVGRGDTILVISNSGRNNVPVETALVSKERGASVIALTSLKHSRKVHSRHSGGKKLFEIADVVLDNQAEYGDAAFRVEGCSSPVGPTSSAVGIAMVQALAVCVTAKLALRGEDPPVFRSSNAGDSDEYNLALAARYTGQA
jgi:uncharacterized phosphosugar-binding protein